MIAARPCGYVKRTLGETLLVTLPGARVGDGVAIARASGPVLRGEVASVEASRVAIAPFGSLAGIAVGDRVSVDPAALRVPAGYGALGRSFDGSGAALDGCAQWTGSLACVDKQHAESPSDRAAITKPFWTGIRAIDGLLTIGRGARVGFFGAPGAGKSTLLEMIVAGAQSDVIVVGLIGERGREAQQWFGRIGRRTTLVCATSDRSAAERVRAAEVAMTQARYLRDRGAHVLLLVDSLARYVAALREQRVGLGEPVGRGGYPPGVWAELARYLERAGNGNRGSITLLATVLSDGADEREPLSEAARSVLDGHIVLSSALARAGHFPAVDVLASTSRTMHAVVSERHARDASAVRGALALLAETKDARSVGLASGGNAALNAAVASEAGVSSFLRQREASTAHETLAALHSVASLAEAHA